MVPIVGAPGTGEKVGQGCPEARIKRSNTRLFVGLAERTRNDPAALRKEAVEVNKAFVKEPSGDDEGEEEDGHGARPPLPAGTRNYITPAGYQRLRAELMTLLDGERPKVVEAVSWAAKNGDRSENGDYLYGKKRLREIDRRIRFLSKRLDIAEVADPSVHHGKDQIFFGATVTYANDQGDERTITIKGIDEADSLAAEVSWIAPIARAMLRARQGDVLSLTTPAGAQTLEVLKVSYPAPNAARAAALELTPAPEPAPPPPPQAR